MEDRRRKIGVMIALTLSVGIAIFVLLAFRSGGFNLPRPVNRQVIIFLIVLLATMGLALASMVASIRKRRKGGKKKKPSRLGNDARQLGMEARDLESHPHTLPFPGHEHLKHKKPTIKKILGGTLDDGRSITFFEHTYIIMAGQTPAPIVHRVVVLDVPEDWPNLRIKKRLAPRWLSRIFGKPTLDLELEAFNKKYALICNDHDFAIAFLEPEFQDWLVEQVPAANWYIEHGRLAHIESGSLKVKDFVRMRDRLQGFMLRIPTIFEPLPLEPTLGPEPPQMI